MWKLIDRIYKTIFRYSTFIGIFLLACAAVFIMTPNICTFPERAKVSKTLSDFRSVRMQFDRASEGSFTTLTIPMDPYADGAYRLLFSSGTLTISSAGPDKQYDDDFVSYDATNGTVSYGDVFTTVATHLSYLSY